MLISTLQQAQFEKYYHTEPQRFLFLPPVITLFRVAPVNAADQRTSLRATLQVADNEFIILMVGSGFKTKGLDRALIALSALAVSLQARCRLLVVGQDNPDKFIALAKKLKIESHVEFLGGRSDIPQLML